MTKRERYLAALHAMQTGVAMEMGIRPEPTQPKHLRVGINSAMSDLSALALLLIDKGVITKDEFDDALIKAAEAERTRYEQHLSGLLGRPVTLR